MNKRSILSVVSGVFVAISIFVSVSAEGLDSFKGKKGEIRIAGGTAHIPVMKEVAKRIMQYNSDIRISIAGGGSGVGIKQVGEGLIDIGNSGRKATDEEIAKHNLKIYKWAIDGIAIIVNPKNKVKALSKKQAQRIFAGDIKNWKQLGGINKQINVYTRDESSGTQNVFWKKALEKGKIHNKANYVASNGAMKASISKDPYGIGFISVGVIDKSVSALAFDGIEPTIKNLTDGKYLVSRGIYSNTKGEPEGLNKNFIDYLFTKEIQTIVANKGFLSVKQ